MWRCSSFGVEWVGVRGLERGGSGKGAYHITHTSHIHPLPRCPLDGVRGARPLRAAGPLGGAAVLLGGVGTFGISRGASRRANPRLAPRVRPPRGARPGRADRADRGICPAFQRRYRDTLVQILASVALLQPRLVPHPGPPRGAQIIRMGLGSCLAFQRRREPLSAILSVRLAVTRSWSYSKWPSVTENGSGRKNNTTSTLALDVVRKMPEHRRNEDTAGA
eukprot:gene7391-biopygen6053